MNPRDLDHIQRFLTTVGRSSLFEYFGVEPDAPDDGVEAAIKQRRAWAQGQQSNPKYRQEAIWVIKNIARCRRAMVDGRLQYIAATRTAAQQKEFEVLDLFILGNIADGVLSVRGERAILEQGDAQGLPRDLVQSRLAELLVERGARREGDVASGPFVDHYAILGAHPDADINSLERAYRERYHAARQLADPRETERVYAELDAAWEVLRSPGTRARYDERHREEREDDPADLTPAASVGRLRLGVETPAAPATDAGTRQPHNASSELAAVARTPHPSRLELVGPDTIELSVEGRRTAASLTVRKVGPGAMPGRVFGDQGWVSVSPSRLDPDVSEQVITVSVDATAMGSTKAVARITVATEDGQRRSVTIHAARRTRTTRAIGAAVLMLGVVAYGMHETGFGPLQPPPPPEGTLVVEVDPPGGVIFVNGDLVSTAGTARLGHGLSIGEPLRIRVEQDGFDTWAGEAILEDGRETRVEVVLVLTDKMDWVPTEGDVRAEIPAEDLQHALAKRTDRFDGCYEKHLEGAAPGSLALTSLIAHVSARGRFIGVRFDAENHPPSDPLHNCLKRQLRSIKLPLFTGDYAVVRHQFRYTVPTDMDAP